MTLATFAESKLTSAKIKRKGFIYHKSLKKTANHDKTGDIHDVKCMLSCSEREIGCDDVKVLICKNICRYVAKKKNQTANAFRYH